MTKQTRLYYAHTESSRWKKRALENVYDLFSDLESDEEGDNFFKDSTLNNYFNLHVCMSLLPLMLPCMCRKITLVSQIALECGIKLVTAGCQISVYEV